MEFFQMGSIELIEFINNNIGTAIQQKKKEDWLGGCSDQRDLLLGVNDFTLWLNLTHHHQLFIPTECWLVSQSPW